MLSDIQKRVERSIYNAVLQKTITEGYTADPQLFDLYNPNSNIAAVEQADYDTALKNIRTLKGFAVEIFANISSQSKGDKKIPRIIIDTEAFYQGELGLDTTEKYESDGADGFNVFTGGSLVSDYHFTIRLVSRTSEETRILHALMLGSIPRRGYIKWYDEAEFLYSQNIHIRYLSSAEQNWLQEGLIERIYRYEVKDLHEEVAREIRQVSKINEIKVFIPEFGIEVDQEIIKIP